MPRPPADSGQDNATPFQAVPSETERHLRVQSITVFVNDADAGLQSYVEKLGFRVAFDVMLPTGERFISISPPNGDTNLALMAPPPGTPMHSLIGRSMQTAFMTEDIDATYKEWSGRGVRFENPPVLQPWGGKVTQFADLDKNIFGLIGIDIFTKHIEEERRKNAKRLEAERSARMEMEIARQVQAKLFPQNFPP
jgi:hypothetical protein